MSDTISGCTSEINYTYALHLLIDIYMIAVKIYVLVIFPKSNQLR